eukprot:2306029-Amphidinium_carterae.1
MTQSWAKLGLEQPVGSSSLLTEPLVGDSTKLPFTPCRVKCSLRETRIVEAGKQLCIERNPRLHQEACCDRQSLSTVAFAQALTPNIAKNIKTTTLVDDSKTTKMCNPPYAAGYATFSSSKRTCIAAHGIVL